MLCQKYVKIQQSDSLRIFHRDGDWKKVSFIAEDYAVAAVSTFHHQ